MGVLINNFSRPRSTLVPERRGGSLIKKQEIVDAGIPIQHRKKPEFKPIVAESATKKFSNSNNPLIVYDTKPLHQVMEGLSFKKKLKRKDGMGVKLEI
jgi:hypothetical protein